MRILDDDGTMLDGELNLSASEHSFEVTLESRGGRIGSASARNSHYERVLERTLARAGQLGASITSAVVETRDTEDLAMADRTLEVDGRPFPIDLCLVHDFRLLRIDLCRPQGSIGRRPEAKGPGNRNKRIRVCFSLPAPRSPAEIKKALESGVIVE